MPFLEGMRQGLIAIVACTILAIPASFIYLRIKRGREQRSESLPAPDAGSPPLTLEPRLGPSPRADKPARRHKAA